MTKKEEMSQAALARYKTAQVTVSSPGELLIALYDGLFRFLNVARHSMRLDKRAQAGEAIGRAHAILSELLMGLDHSKAPELCQNLSSLYEFSMSRLTMANMKQDATMIDDVIRVLTPVREGFTEAVKQVAREGTAPKATK
jgi:flagellar protein FliS